MQSQCVEIVMSPILVIAELLYRYPAVVRTLRKNKPYEAVLTIAFQLMVFSSCQALCISCTTRHAESKDTEQNAFLICSRYFWRVDLQRDCNIESLYVVPRTTASAEASRLPNLVICPALDYLSVGPPTLYPLRAPCD